MKVYVAILSHYEGMAQTIEETMGFNVFLVKEIQSRGFEVVSYPNEADVLFLPPTWQYDKECFSEYQEFKESLLVVTDIEALSEITAAGG